MNPIRLTIGYSTLGDRVANIQLPVQRDDVDILIVVQGEPVNAPQRSDVSLVVVDSYGVTKSRNEVLRRARGEVLIFGDDDIVWDAAGLDAALAEFAANPELALLLGRGVDETGSLRKRYPAAVERLSKWNSAKAATYEMLVRPEVFRRSEVWFDEQFGAGAVNYLGDEYILIADAAAAGLLCEFHPITVAMHPTESSGSRYRSMADARARSLIFTRVFGPLLAIPVRAVFVARDPSRFAGITSMLRFVFGVFPRA